MAKSRNTVPIARRQNGRSAIRSGVMGAQRAMVVSISYSSVSMAGVP